MVHGERETWPGNPYWRGRISTVDLLVQTTLDHSLFILNIWFTCVTKEAVLIRRSTVLSLPLQLSFHGLAKRGSSCWHDRIFAFSTAHKNGPENYENFGKTKYYIFIYHVGSEEWGVNARKSSQIVSGVWVETLHILSFVCMVLLSTFFTFECVKKVPFQGNSTLLKM